MRGITARSRSRHRTDKLSIKCAALYTFSSTGSMMQTGCRRVAADIRKSNIDTMGFNMPICSLTHTNGNYVNSHIIPRALTKPRNPKYPFIQMDLSGKTRRRWSSWSDRKLVNRAGEDILAEIDTWAIAALRRHKLIWSSWKFERELGVDYVRFGSGPWGIRRLDNLDGKKLRIFFLSLLWRAAATSLYEFDEIELPADHLETLRKIIIGDADAPKNFYPIMLTQVSSIGVIHNCAPVRATKVVPQVDVYPEMVVQFFRFYFDGLIAHIHQPYNDPQLVEHLGPLIVGGDAGLTISTVAYEGAKQKEFAELLHRAVVQRQ